MEEDSYGYYYRYLAANSSYDSLRNLIHVIEDKRVAGRAKSAKVPRNAEIRRKESMEAEIRETRHFAIVICASGLGSGKLRGLYSRVEP